MLAALFLVGCAKNPVTGEREFNLLSERQEIAIGRVMDVQVRREMGVYESEALQAYVDRVGQQIARTSDRPDLPWHFVVVDVPAVNAFALPGGYIYLTRGILAFLQDEAELAGVLGHEVGHVAARHAAQAYTRSTSAQVGLTLGSIFFPEARPYTQVAATGLGLLFLEYGRDDELQADRLGTRYAAEAGLHPEGVADMLRTLARLDEISNPEGLPSWLQTHPEPGERVDEVTAFVDQLARRQGTLTVNRAEYLRQVDGLVYGPDTDEGIVRGREFLHPAQRFAITFPLGWRVVNGKTQVVARTPDDRAYVVLQHAEVGGGDFDVATRRWMARAGFRQVRGSSTRISGLPAHVGTYLGTIDGLGRVGVRAVHVRHRGLTYLVAGVAPVSRFDAYDHTFEATLTSFRPLTAAAAARIKPTRLDVRTVRAGDTWESFAAAGDASITPEELAILNGSVLTIPPVPGIRIKIVQSGSRGR